MWVFPKSVYVLVLAILKGFSFQNLQQDVFSCSNVFWYNIYSWAPFYSSYNAKTAYVAFHLENTFNQLVCQMCGNYYHTQSEIMKLYKKNN